MELFFSPFIYHKTTLFMTSILRGIPPPPKRGKYLLKQSINFMGEKWSTWDIIWVAFEQSIHVYVIFTVSCMWLMYSVNSTNYKSSILYNNLLCLYVCRVFLLLTSLGQTSLASSNASNVLEDLLRLLTELLSPLLGSQFVSSYGSPEGKLRLNCHQWVWREITWDTLLTICILYLPMNS